MFILGTKGKIPGRGRIFSVGHCPNHLREGFTKKVAVVLDFV